MTTLAAFVSHELRLQRRSARFAVLAIGFVALAALPALVAFHRWPTSLVYLGPATFAAETFAVLPLLAVTLAFAFSADGIEREKAEGSWRVLSLAPMSNTGYLVYRWVAGVTLLLPLAAAPVAVAATAAALRCGGIAPGPFVWPLLMQVWPLVLAASAIGLAAGVVARGVLGGTLLAGVSFALLGSGLERLSGRFHLSLDGVRGLLDLSEARWTVLGLWGYLRGEGLGAQRYPVPASEAPFAPRVAAEQYLSQGIVLVGIALLALALAALLLGRTQRDLRPWRPAPDHPLRNLVAFVNRFRRHMTPDAGLGRADLAFVVLGLVACAAALGIQGLRSERYRDVAERKLASIDGGAATPLSAVPLRYAVVGRIGPSGEVSTHVTFEMENRGAAVQVLVFALNPGLRVIRLSSDVGSLHETRSWDRLSVEFEPEIPPGGHRTLSFEIAGRPLRYAFAVGGWIGADRGTLDAHDFADTFDPATGRGVDRLDRSYVVPALTRSRLALTARDLAPVPRYAAGGEAAPPEVLDLDGSAWSADPYRPTAELTVDLEVPAGLFVADACGALVTPPGEPRLQGHCRLPPADYAVVGGRYRVLPAEADEPLMAVFPHHAELARRHLGSLAHEAALADELWPGLPRLSSRIIVEWPDPAVHRLGSYVAQVWNPLAEDDPRIAVPHGRLLLVAERRLASRQRLEVAPFLAGMVANELLARRPVQPAQEDVFRKLYEELARLRLGATPENGAVVPWIQSGPGAVEVPLLEAADENRLYWKLRFPALVYALESRLGDRAIQEAVEHFTEGAGVGSFADLLARIHDAGGGALDRFVADFVVAGELPQATLADVHMRSEGDGWRIDGQLLNRGSGLAVCTVEGLTAVGSVSTAVAVSPDRPGRFELRTRYRPQAVLLDPEQLCHRYRPIVPVPIERVDLGGDS